MKRVVVVSPLSGNRERNKHYARMCMVDCLRRGEAPIAFHEHYDHPNVLDDTQPEDRALGIAASRAWGAQAELFVAYLDLNPDKLSQGMYEDMLFAISQKIPTEMRTLPGDLFRRFELADRLTR